jgi:hypothetical protein
MCASESPAASASGTRRDRTGVLVLSGLGFHALTVISCIRAVELTAGAPSRRGRVPGSGDARQQAKLEREMERAVLAQAEAAYVAFVEVRQKTDAVAAKRGATGLSQGQSPARLRGGVESPISALRHGVDRVQTEDTPTA